MLAQYPQIVDVKEWTSEKPKMFLEILNHWAQLEAEETGYQTFVLQVMVGNKLYLCRAYDNMKELVKILIKDGVIIDGKIKLLKNGKVNIPKTIHLVK